MKFLKLLVLVAAPALLSACGTTFSLPAIDPTSQATADKMFADPGASTPRRQLSASQGEQRFHRVARRITPVARSFCDTLMADKPGFDCAARVEIDRELDDRNAYFTYIDGKPVIRLSLPLLRDTRNDDEVAFVMGHEFGHLLGRHIEKQDQQRLAGAIILGSIAAAVNAEAAAYGGYTDPNLVSDSVNLGAAIGSVAYSQTYELESDTLGTYIADAAGYDAVRGAQYFARPDEAQRVGQRLSFWGTHPPDAKRVATVIAAQKRIDAGLALEKLQ